MPSAIVMAGGTGGHIFPALAVAEQLRHEGWHIQWLGTADRMEAQLVPQYQFPIHFLPVKGLRGKGLWNKLLAITALLKSVVSALRLVKRFKPDVVVGFGGYPSGPGGIAAWLSGKPLIIHEQNAIPGTTNKLLSKLAKQVLVAFELTKQRFAEKGVQSQVVGNPLRQSIGAKALNKPSNKDGQPLNLLVIGGSLGAQILNQTIPEISAKISGVSIVHQCGKGNEQSVLAAYEQNKISAEVVEFIDDMAARYAWADAVICRAGALTVCEVAEAGLAACFVPLPHAIDDHQTYNAQVLSSASAAVLIPQSELSQRLPAVLEAWIADPQQYREMGAKANTILPKDATKQIVDVCNKYRERPA